ASSVALGAFGAHALKGVVNNDQQKLQMWGTAAHYQLVHAAALLGLGASGLHKPYTLYLWTAGVTMFSGSIYLLVLWRDQFKWIAPVTPLGGLSMMAGWLALLI
ncbi:hypothetical protein EV182_007446, partial [Spiromyces aspiralis]